MQGEDLSLTGDVTAENIAARSIISLRNVVLLNVTVDPSIAPGIAAPLGSLALLSGTGAWQKTGAPNTAWTPIGGGGGVVGPGTVDHVSKFTAANAVGDSQITDDGANIDVHAAGALSLTAATGAELIGAAGLNLQGGNNSVLGAANAVLVQAGTTGTMQSGGALTLQSTGATVNVDALGSAMALTAASSFLASAGTTADVNAAAKVTVTAGADLELAATGSLILGTAADVNASSLDGMSFVTVNPGANIGLSTAEGNIELHSAVTGAAGDLILSADHGNAQLLANGVSGNITVSGPGNINITTPQNVGINGSASVTVTAAGGTIDINGAGPIVIDAVAPTIISNDPAHPVGFYGTAGVAQQAGVPVTAAGIHAALVALGLITP